MKVDLINRIRTYLHFQNLHCLGMHRNIFIRICLSSSKLCKRSLLFFACLFISCVFLYHYFNLGDALELYLLENRKTLPREAKFKVLEHMTIPDRLKGKKLAFHQIFEPRKVSFIDYNYTVGSGRKEGKPKTILLGTPWNGVWTTINYYYLRPEDTSFTNFGCPNSNCFVTKDASQIQDVDAVLFHLLDLPEEFPKYRHPNQIWIAYILESPWRVKANRVDMSRLDNLFNWTMSYRDDSDIKIKYGFIGPRVEDNNYEETVTERIPFTKKKSIVWFVSDCNVPSHRQEYVQQLSKYIEVDVYGACGTKKCFPSQSSMCYDDILKSYKFYLSFENSICKDYVTEKYFNALEYNVVPVVFGGADYQRVGPPEGFIDASKFPNPSDLATFLSEISSDEDKYSRYLNWKSSYRAYLYPWMCYLCDKLHGPFTPSVKKDLKKWWMDESQCKTWDIEKGFVGVN